MKKSILVGALIFLTVQFGLSSERPLQPQSRVSILRELIAERATLRRDLPNGSKGFHLGADGKIDERVAAIQLAKSGRALRAGELVQITKIDFKKDRIIFEINGGGKDKSKWYERIEIGVGGGNTQSRSSDTADRPNGSLISLNFNQDLFDMTAGQLKSYLEPVLDFNIHTANLLIPERWSGEVEVAVKNHQLVAGMTRDAVLASKGRPDNKIREKIKGVEQETWVYGKVPNKVLLITFENGVLVEAREYIPGVPATKVPRIEEQN